jgi:hypothetical protein
MANKYGIGFNSQGKWTAYPGVVVTVDATDLDLASVGPTGVVALLGTGSGFFPPKEYSRLPVEQGTPDRYLAAGSDLLVQAQLAVKSFSQLGTSPADIYVVPVNLALQSSFSLQGTAAATLNLVDNAAAVVIRLATTQPGVSVEYVDTAGSEALTITQGAVSETIPGDPTDNAAFAAAINAGSTLVTATVVAATPPVAFPVTAFPPPAAGGPVATLTSVGWGAMFNDITAAVSADVLTISLPTASGVAPITERYTWGPATTIASFVDDINGRSAIVSAVAGIGPASGLAPLPQTNFTGGADGMPATVTDWMDAIAALSTLRVTCVHVCTADPDVWAALSTWCDDHRARGFIGSETVRNWNGITNRAIAIEELIQEAALVNSPRIMHVGLGMNGLPGKYAAARYAALASCLEPSVPMTFKFLDVESIETRLSIPEAGDETGLLVNGVSPPMPDATNAFTYRVSRGLSTWTGDSNLYRREHSVLAAVDALSQQIDDAMQDYIGGEGNQGTLGRIREKVRGILEAALAPAAPIRINAYDPNIVVAFTSATVVHVTAKVTPIPPINWIAVQLILQQTDITLTTEVNLAA